jgi:hypothetical protein
VRLFALAPRKSNRFEAGRVSSCSKQNRDVVLADKLSDNLRGCFGRKKREVGSCPVQVLFVPLHSYLLSSCGIKLCPAAYRKKMQCSSRALHRAQPFASGTAKRAALQLRPQVCPHIHRSLALRSPVSGGLPACSQSSSDASNDITSSSTLDQRCTTAKTHGARTPGQSKPWFRSVALLVAVVALHSLVLSPVGDAIAAAAGSTAAATAGSPIQSKCARCPSQVLCLSCMPGCYLALC